MFEKRLKKTWKRLLICVLSASVLLSGCTLTERLESEDQTNPVQNMTAIDEDIIGLGYYVSESTRTYIPQLLDQGVTAILFSHDIRAISAITECNDREIRIPEDLSIIGFDDLPIAESLTPSLTTIRQNRSDLGKSAASLLDNLLTGVAVSKILLRAEFIERDSTGRCKEL